jgi:Pectate lyase superfamily protein
MLASLALVAALAACGSGGGATLEEGAARPSAADTAFSAAASAPASALSAMSDTSTPRPVVFNASRSARAGDIVSVQGENFGTAPMVWLDALGSTPTTPLPVLNQVGTGWLAVQIPAGATGALALRISNGPHTSASVKLNAAMPHHLDAMQIVPGGAFRLFGRNLALPGSKPTVTVDGQAASVNLAASDEHMLSVTAPTGLRASSAAVITVDNGNGTGASTLDRSISIVTGHSGDVLGLGVGWAAAFGPLVARPINAATDSRLASRVACDGKTDDSAAMQAALVFAQRNGGGVVTLPAGVCVLSKGVQLLDGTVLQGAGKERTELQHLTDSAIYSDRADRIAVRALTLSNTSGGAGSSLNLKNSSRVAVQSVRVNQGAKAMAWMYGNTNIVVSNSEFLQTGSIDAPGAVHATANAGLVFTSNTISFLNNTGTDLGRTSDAFVQGNRWTRDASRQTDPGVVHTVAINFAHRIALVGNEFTTVNGPVDPAKNDGETILTEGGGPRRTEGLGRVTSATSSTIFDSTGSANRNALVNGALPENYGIAIISGRGAGQTRRVISFDAGTISVDRAWDLAPDSSSRYATAVWGLERAIIKGNSLTHNARGIWLYSTAARDVDIVGNTLLENGGILVRSFQDVGKNWFSPMINVRVVGNTLTNTARRFPSYLSIYFANVDGLAIGTSHIGVEVRRNDLTANNPNLDSSRFDTPAAREGYMNLMFVSSSSAVTSSTPPLLGTVMQDNTCTNCATAFRLGTGAVGTMLMGNSLLNSGGLWSNSAAANSGELALATWVR